MYEGFLEFGGGEVLNNARAKGYTSTAPCPVNWLVCPPCDGIRDYLGDDPYTYETIFDAPWYDAEDEVTHRFLGAHAISVEGIPDSTREASVAEAMLDGGVVGRVRHATRRTRYRAVLTALGEDALEAGFSWLSSALTPGSCGTHGDGCGAADTQFFTACPPERADITMPEVFWNDPVTNQASNPSFEASGPAITARVNIISRPNMELAYGSLEVRRNLVMNPRAVAGGGNWTGYGGSVVPYSNAVAGAYTYATDASAVPAFVRQTGVAETTTEQGELGFGNNQAVIAGQRYAGSVMVRSSVAAHIWIRYRGSASGDLSSAVVILVPNIWTKVPYSFTVPAGDVTGSFTVRMQGTGPALGAGGTLDAARAMIVPQTDIVWPYFDGTTPPDGDGLSAAWTGAANNSPSVLVGQQVSSNANDDLIGYQSGPVGNRHIKIVPKWKQPGWGMVLRDAIPCVSGRTYTAMLDVTLNKSMIVNFRLERGTPDPASFWAGTLAAGQHHLPVTFTYTDTGQGQPVIALGVNEWHDGTEVIRVDNVLVTEGKYTGPYFDGSTRAKVRRNLHSMPQAQGRWGSAGDAVATPSDFATGGPTGGGFRRFSFSQAGGGVYAYAPVNAPVVPGAVYTTSMYVRVSVATEVSNNTVPYLPNGDYGGGEEFAKLTPVPGVWTRIPLTLMPVPPGATEYQVRARIQAVPGAMDFDVAMGMVEQGPVATPFFDGSNPAAPYAAAWDGNADESTSYLYDPDFTYVWGGTLNDSESLQRSANSQGIGGVNVAATQSTRWAGNRAKSLRLTPNTGSQDSFGYIEGDIGSLHLGMVPGRTYTAQVTVHLEAPQTAPQPNARTIEAFYGQPSIGYTKIMSSPAPNLAGDHLISVTFTLPANANEAFIRLQVGSAVSSDEVWWDSFMLVEGQYGAPYFDGATPDSTPEELEVVGAQVAKYDWTGTPDASTSTYTTGSVVAVPDPVEYDRILNNLTRYLHTVTCVSGPIVEQKLHRGDTWGYIVEFVLVAAVPWMFSVTKPVILQPSIPVVVQDVPFNLVPYPSAELESGTVVAAKNWAQNPSVEVDGSSWAHQSTVVLPGDVTSGRSTALAAQGSASFRAHFVATNAGSGGRITIGHTTATFPPAVAGQRMSVNIWANRVIVSGSPALGQFLTQVVWRAGTTVLRTDNMTTLPAGGGPVSMKSIAVPVGADNAIVQVYTSISLWAIGDTVDLYADAIAVTVP